MRKTWVRIGSALQKQIRGSVSAVDKFHNIIYHRYGGKARLEAGLYMVLLETFKLTKGTLMLSRQIQKKFWLSGNTTADSKSLEGTYVAPKVLSERMVSMLQMIGEVDIVVKDRMVNIVITLQDYIKY